MKEEVTKKVTLFSATLLCVTAMMGSGWLFSSQLVAAKAGNYSFLAWILAAFIILLVGLCYAKIVAIHPLRGATTRISAISHNSIFAMPFAFANWFGIVVCFATEALATTQYLSGINSLNFLVDPKGLTIYGKLVSLFILCIYLLVNYFGAQFLSKINNAITAFKIIVPIIIVILFVIYGLSNNHGVSNFTQIPNNNFSIGSIFSAVVAGGLIYTFNGFQVSVSYASEIDNPTRNVPLSLIFSILIALGLYLALQYGYMDGVPHSYLVSHGGWANLDFSSPLLDVATILGLNYLAMLLLLNSIVSPSGTGYVYLGTASRMLYGMSSEGQMPKYFANLHPVFDVSRRSLIANFLLAVFFLMFSDNWAGMMLLVTAYNLIGYLAAPISMGALIPKSRLFGLVVFIVISLLLITLSTKAKIYMFVSFVILMLIYASTEYNRVGFKNLVYLIFPFLLYVGLICLVSNYYLFGIISAIFYLVATNQKFIEYCKIHAVENSD
ncbi:APC family permease [Francisella uliginis]|uniref:Amino acid transporter n=1 Tax=Francisella uliginis TaxID=573570 RepID=A0A1L4BR83_9GAMM|nr:APC family permease [Francisella uliginis]API86364.1 amino acid transporter [Francisella uliginis]